MVVAGLTAVVEALMGVSVLHWMAEEALVLKALQMAFCL